MKGTAELTHDIPCGPDPDSLLPEEGTVLHPRRPIVIDWEPVTKQLDPATGECPEGEGSSEIEIEGYQVIVEREEPCLLVFSVAVEAEKTRVTVSPEFFDRATLYKFEVLARE